MGILSGNPKKEPMHYGEIYGAWSYLVSIKGALVRYQVFANHAGDLDLKQFIRNYIDNAIRPQIQQVEELLKANELALPPTPPERANAKLEEIPVGARITDQEVAAVLGVDLGAGLVVCSQMIGQSIREDIHMMFSRFHTENAKHGLQLLRITKEKGWLVPPPLHVDLPEPVPV